MIDLFRNVTRPTLDRLTHALLPLEGSDDFEIELVIAIDDKDINIRELVAYLSLIDGLYGRLSESNFFSYSRNHRDQLKINEVRFGSFEISINDFINVFNTATPLAIVYLAIRLLPSLGEFLKNAADAYKSYEDGRLIRENRKKLRKEMGNIEGLGSLDRKSFIQISNLIEGLLLAESRKIPASRRLAQKSVKSVKILPKRKRS